MDKNVFEARIEQRKHLVSFAVLVVVIILLWKMLNLVLLTFLFTFLFYYLREAVQRVCVVLGEKRLPNNAVTVGIYLGVLAILALASISFIPKLMDQIQSILVAVDTFDNESFYSMFGSRWAQYINIQADIDGFVSQMGSGLAVALTKITGFGLNVLLALLMSIIILLEQHKLSVLVKAAQESPNGYVFDYIFHFGSKFASTFGKVMKVQGTISFINCIISMIVLAILGFNNIWGLGFMIFILGFIPVAGVVISFVPLSVMAFNLGGPAKVLVVILLIVGLHTLETYIMNPKLMSMRTELPVCFVFFVLLVGEHYLGIWGLLIGVPLFVCLMDEAGVNYSDAMRNYRENKKAEKTRHKEERMVEKLERAADREERKQQQKAEE